MSIVFVINISDHCHTRATHGSLIVIQMCCVMPYQPLQIPTNWRDRENTKQPEISELGTWTSSCEVLWTHIPNKLSISTSVCYNKAICKEIREERPGKSQNPREQRQKHHEGDNHDTKSRQATIQ